MSRLFFPILMGMSAKQNQDKLDKRAAALRDNLRKRKPAAKKPTKNENKNKE